MSVLDRNDKENHIIESAIRAFAVSGFEKTSVPSLAKEAGIATGSLYTYFKNKAELFEQCCSFVAEKFMEHINPAFLAKNPVYEVIKQSLEFFRDNSNYARIALVETQAYSIQFVDSKVLSLWHTKIGNDIFSKLKKYLPFLADGIDPTIYMSLVIGGVEYIITRFLFDSKMTTLDVDGIANQLYIIITCGGKKDE